MALEEKEMALIAQAKNFNMWRYGGGDSIATIGASGYLDGMAEIVNEGDLVFTNGGILRVAGIADGVVTTASYS